MKVRPLEDRDRWNQWVAEENRGSILQSYEWGEIKAGFGWEAKRLIAEDGDRIVGGVQMLFRRLPLGVIAYAPRGPIVNISDVAALDPLVEAMHSLARQKRAIFLKIEPQALGCAAARSLLAERGFIGSSTIQPRSTLIIDLRADLDMIASRLNPKTRYNIGLAKRKGVEVHQGASGDLAHFYTLLTETGRRSGFSVHSSEYYEAIWDALKKRGMAQLLLAIHQGRPLAAALVFALGQRAYYMYSASSCEQRNLKPNDLLQWECINWAKSIGCTSYDLWGVPDEIGAAAEQGQDPDSEDLLIDGRRPGQMPAMWGVYRFKRGFGGELVRYLGAFDYVYAPARYRAYLACASWARPLLAITAWGQETISRRRGWGRLLEPNRKGKRLGRIEMAETSLPNLLGPEVNPRAQLRIGETTHEN